VALATIAYLRNRPVMAAAPAEIRATIAQEIANNSGDFDISEAYCWGLLFQLVNQRNTATSRKSIVLNHSENLV